MSNVHDLHKKWSRDANSRQTYAELGPEFQLARSPSFLGKYGMPQRCSAAAGESK